MSNHGKQVRWVRTAELAAAILVTLVVPLGTYVLAARTAATADHSTLSQVVCFEPGRETAASGGRIFAAGAMAVSAVALLFVIPGLLAMLAFMRRSATRAIAHAWSLAGNSVALISLCLVLRHTCGIDRVSFGAAWLGWTAVLLALAWQPGRSWRVVGKLCQDYGRSMAVASFFLAVAILILFPEQLFQCFSEDGTETFELARSLREHVLPYWELETWDPIPGGRMGTVVVNPSLINSYWTCGLQTLLGDGELATRLPYWVWWLAIFAVLCRMTGAQGRSWSAAVPLGLIMLLAAELFTFYVGYNPYMADLANPGVPDALFTLLLLLAFDCLRHRDGWGWVLSMTLATLVLYAGAVLLVLTLVCARVWKPIEPKETLRWALRAAGTLTLVAAFYLGFGWADGSLFYWVDTLDIEYVNDYLAAAPRWQSGLLFLGYFVLGCGGIAAAGLLTAWRRSAWHRTVAATTLAYLLIVLSSGFKNLHYLGPILPIPLLLFLSSTEATGSWLGRRRLLAACSTFVCIALCWPAARQVVTLNRRLGSNTTVTTDSYLRAVGWARLRYQLREEDVMAWDCDQYTWVAYAELDSTCSNPRTFVLTDGGLPTRDYHPVASGRVPGIEATVSLYTRDIAWAEQLLAKRPLRPLQRYPAVFRPLADGPFSPHNNTLEDVRRLRWPW